jgi:tripartite-type tricarboxylate transporter receptor subunit TctC
VIGVDTAAKSAPDGYTLLLSGDAAVINTASGRKLPYDLLRDLAPLSLVYSGGQILLVQKDSRFNSLQDLVQYAKANPDRLKYGSSGVGTSIHLSSEIFNRAAGIKTLHVPYKGVAPAMNDLAGGHVDFVIAGTSVAIPGTRNGLYRALAIMSRQRSPLLPQAPTATEQGVPAETGAWYGLFLPAGAPPAVVKKLHAAVAAALASSEVIERFRSLGGEPMSSSQAEFASYLRAQIQKLSALMRELNIKLE